jgi:predicted nucleic acid-binding protein
MTLYLDTSSIVKLYVDEAGTRLVRDLVASADVVATSVLAYAETRAALARLRRERLLSPSSFLAAKRQFERDWPHYLTVDVTDALSRAAGALAEKHGLRGFGSLHLATFLEILGRSDADDEVQFSSFDDRLNDAARTTG